jgi:integrase
LTSAVLETLNLQSKEARSPWLPQTFFRELANLDGAFSTLGKYATNVDFGLRLSDSTAWKTAKSAWQRLAIAHQPTHQTAATAADIQAAVNATNDEEIATFLRLLWLSCARKGDVAKLRTEDVTLQPSGRLEFFVQEGKGVLARRGKYHVISHCPPAWRLPLQRFLDSRPKNSRLLRSELGRNNEVLQALRCGNPSLSCRSVRRGALQCIARDAQVSEETLMRMSGHRSVATLHRYLDWDAINEGAHSAAQRAAQNLSAELLLQH